MKGIASDSKVKEAAQALQKSGGTPVFEAKEVLSGMAKDKNIPDALRGAPTGKIADVVKAAAGELQKGVEAMNSTNPDDVRAALHRVGGSEAAQSAGLFNLSGSQLVSALREAVPKAGKALQDAFSLEDKAGEQEPPARVAVERIERVVERVKEVSSDSPMSIVTSLMGVLMICGFCAFYNLKFRRQARSPSLDYGIQLQSNMDEPFFRQF